METPDNGHDEAANSELLALAGRINDGQGTPNPGGDGSAPAGGPTGAGGSDADQGKQLLGLARVVVGAVCKAVTARWPAAVYSEGEQAVMAGLLVPVWIKHVKSPWFVQWQEELAAGGYALFMGYTGWDRVRASKATASNVPPGDPAGAPGVVM